MPKEDDLKMNGDKNVSNITFTIKNNNFYVQCAYSGPGVNKFVYSFLSVIAERCCYGVISPYWDMLVGQRDRIIEEKAEMSYTCINVYLV